MLVARNVLAATAPTKVARRALHAVFASSIFLLCGCPVRYNAPEPFDLQDVTKRQVTASAPMRTRSELHQILEQPILSSERRRVDIFVLSGEQIVPEGFPVVLRKERIPYRGYTLVTYDNEQRVEAAASGFSSSSRDYSDISLAAGDYQLNYGTGFGLRLSVTQNRFLSDRRIQPPAMGCTLLIACDPNPVEKLRQPVGDQSSPGENSGAPVCWRMTSLDGGNSQPMIWPRVETYGKNGQLAVHDLFVPFSVAAGQHTLEFSSPELIRSELTMMGRLEGDSLRANLSCHDGELLYIVLTGHQTESYSAAKRLVRRFLWGYAAGRVEVTRDSPPQLKQHTVLLFNQDDWLLPDQDNWLLPEDRQGK